MHLSLSKVTDIRIYRVKNLSFYHPEHFVDVELITYKIIQTCTGDHCLYIMNTVQKAGLPAAVQL